MSTEIERIQAALECLRDGSFDGEHHKQWVIDQTVRILTDCPMVPMVNHHGWDSTKNDWCDVHYEGRGESDAYLAWVREQEGDPEDEDNYYGEWDTGIAP